MLSMLLTVFKSTSHIENVGVSGGNENELYGNKALCKLDTVTNLMNIYFICIDKDIVNNSDAVINLQGITLR